MTWADYFAPDFDSHSGHKALNIGVWGRAASEIVGDRGRVLEFVRMVGYPSEEMLVRAAGPGQVCQGDEQGVQAAVCGVLHGLCLLVGSRGSFGLPVLGLRLLRVGPSSADSVCILWRLPRVGSSVGP